MLVQKGSSPDGNHSIARIYASGPAKRLVMVYRGSINNEPIWLLRQILALVADRRAAGNPPRDSETYPMPETVQSAATTSPKVSVARLLHHKSA